MSARFVCNANSTSKVNREEKVQGRYREDLISADFRTAQEMNTQHRI